MVYYIFLSKSIHWIAWLSQHLALQFSLQHRMLFTLKHQAPMLLTPWWQQKSETSNNSETNIHINILRKSHFGCICVHSADSIMVTVCFSLVLPLVPWFFINQSNGIQLKDNIEILYTKINSIGNILNPLVGRFPEDPRKKRKGAKIVTPHDWPSFHIIQSFGYRVS